MYTLYNLECYFAIGKTQKSCTVNVQIVLTNGSELRDPPERGHAQLKENGPEPLVTRSALAMGKYKA